MLFPSRVAIFDNSNHSLDTHRVIERIDIQNFTIEERIPCPSDIVNYTLENKEDLFLALCAIIFTTEQQENGVSAVPLILIKEEGMLTTYNACQYAKLLLYNVKSHC